MRRLLWVSALFVSAALVPQTVRAVEPDAQQFEFFEKKIRPLLVSRCFDCHANGQTKGSLSLESSASLLKGGDSGPAIVPGKPDESLLIEAVSHQGAVKMPPKQKLTDREVADLKTWVLTGAAWSELKGTVPPSSETQTAPAMVITPEQRSFWSFRPIADPPLPASVSSGIGDATWPQNSIDAFILASLEERGLKPSAPAERRGLIRRATFDLTGLPPTLDEVEAFANDTAPGAFARVVDRLLASPRYGERWGRHWLDVARYGEDQAHTFQARQYPAGYRYRDWVVKALNNDMPYDRFITEQLAGDLLDGGVAEDRLIALGYFALGPVYYKDAGCAAKAAADELDDRVDLVASAFLGLTVVCARCHDHKFDPISQQDYFGLAGVFSSTNYREAPLDPPDVVARYDEAQGKIKSQDDAINKFLETEAARLAPPIARDAARYIAAVWTMQHPEKDKPASDLEPAKLAKQHGLHEFVLKRWLKALTPGGKNSITRLEKWFELARQPDAASAPVASGAAIPLEVVKFAADVQSDLVAALAEKELLEKQYVAALAAAAEADKAKVARPALEKASADLLAAFVTGRDGPCAVPKENAESLLAESEKQKVGVLRIELEILKKTAPAKYAIAHSLTEGTAANMKIHLRGNPAKTGAEAPRRFLTILAGENPAPFSQGSGRLELARAIASPDNPLTARVIVNRLWQHHFGRGLVGTPSNFGALGERPTHPLLLDHLAQRFIRQGWSLKGMHREIMLSATYQQSSGFDAKNFEIDPDNRFLWRMNRRRLDVEAWRDALLAASGNLNPAFGGPSVNLESAGNGRRTLYGSVSRHNLDPLLRLFDFPDPNITSPNRAVTTVPLQQLFVLNSEFMLRQSKSLAGHLAAAAPDDGARIRRAFLLAYGRAATDEEVQLGIEFLSAPESAVSTAETGASKSSLTRWEQYAQVLLGANEFAFVD